MKAIKTIFTALATLVATVPSIDCFANSDQMNPIVSHYNDDEAKVRMIVNDLHEKIQTVNDLTNMARELYFTLLAMNTEEARNLVIDSGPSHYEGSEMFIRAFEIFAKSVAEDNVGHEIVHSEILKYWKSIAKARFEIARLNNFVKQLTTIPEVYESNIDFNGLKELAKYATDKVNSGKYGLI